MLANVTPTKILETFCRDADSRLERVIAAGQSYSQPHEGSAATLATEATHTIARPAWTEAVDRGFRDQPSEWMDGGKVDLRWFNQETDSGWRALADDMPKDQNMPQAAIFDVDGTLIDSVDLHATAWQRAFAEFGHQVSSEQAGAHIGKGGDQLLPIFLTGDQQADHGRALGEWRGKLF